MVKSWCALGVLVFVYVNNFVVVASLPEVLCQIHNQIVAPSLECLGWVWETTKGMWEPSQLVEVMGLLLNLHQGCVLIPEVKLWRTEPQVQVYLHEAYALVGGQHDQWDQLVVVSPAAASDLQWVAMNLCQIQGALMWWLSRVAMVFSDTVQTMGWGAFLLETSDQVWGGHLACEQAQPIHLLEMRAVLHRLVSFAHLLQGQQVECWTNNMTALAYVVNGRDLIM